jgi:hypothetical protein
MILFERFWLFLNEENNGNHDKKISLRRLPPVLKGPFHHFISGSKRGEIAYDFANRSSQSVPLATTMWASTIVCAIYVLLLSEK